GQIFLEEDLFNSGVRPAIDAGSSVSRVGGDAQIKAMKKVAGTLKLDLASFRELEAFSQFGSDLDESTQAKLNRGQRSVEVLKQGLHEPIAVEKQVVILFCLSRGYLDDIPIEDISRYEEEIYTFMDENNKGILDHIRESGQLPEEDDFKSAVEAFQKNFVTSESK